MGNVALPIEPGSRHQVLVCAVGIETGLSAIFFY